MRALGTRIRRTAERRLGQRSAVAVACALVATAACVLTVVLLRPASHVAPTPTARKAPTPAGGHGSVRVALRPRVVLRGQRAVITVSGNVGSSPQVQIVGATTNLGHALPWLSLQRTAHGWQALLPAPEFRGVYRIRLRTAISAPAFGSDGWLLRVYAKGTLTRPLLESPEAVARSWTQSLSTGADPVALKRWPLPAFDHRDPQLHQLVVISYTLKKGGRISEPRGVFVTAVRDTSRGRWRLLEATVSPQ